MAYSPLKPCGYPSCPALTKDGYCDNHRMVDPALERRRFYGSTLWKRLRNEFLSENPFCIECKKDGIIVLATTADHINPRLARPDLALDKRNLQALCNTHHSIKTQLEKTFR